MKMFYTASFSRRIIIYLFCFLGCFKLSATNVSGPQSGTWNVAGSPYVLSGTVPVPAGQTLTINPGVEVQFPLGSQLDVQGTLIAQGTNVDSINFRGGTFSSFTQRGPITFENTGSNSILRFVNISQLGYNGNSDYTAAIIVNSSSCTISNCAIQNIRGTAISVANSISPVISNNVFTANVNLDIILGLDNVRLLKGNNPLKVGLLASTMAVNDTLTATNIYYRLLASQTVPLSKTLVVNPGVEVQFTNGASTISQLDVQGTLEAQGDVSNYINFTGGPFSSFTQRGPITFENTSSNSILQYVSIRQLGYNGNSDYTAAIIVNSSSCTILNCNIQNIQGTAISIANSVNPVISNNVFTANTNMDVILGLDNVRLPKGNNPLKVGLLASTMAVNDTLTTINIYYRLLASQTVPLSKTLVINPGVEVQFTNGASTISQLDVQGTLKAQGDASNYINFTGGPFSSFTQRGPITFENTSSNSILQYVSISQLGYNGNSDYTAAIIVNSSSCTISNCKIQNIQGTAISIANSFNPVINNNAFTANTNMDVILGLDNVRLPKGNDRLKVGLLASSMGLNDTLTNNNMYYRLLASQTVPLSKTLVINPGVEVQFTNGASTISQLDVQGTLKAQGDVSNYIKFTGGTFSSFTQRGPITFESGSNSILQFVNISQLGYNSNSNTTPIIIIKSSSCQIINSIIQMNKGVAVQITNSASPTVLQSCFYSNVSGAVLSTSGSPKFKHCNFVGNTSGIVNTSATDIVKADSCWWGSTTGPFQRTTNPAGAGDSVSVGVVYTDFALEQFDCSAEAGPLPLTLLNFQAYLSGNNYVNCNWQTATESNTGNFIVERSIDGTNYNAIGKVSAAGYSSIIRNYQFADNSPNKGINYYRLKMVDKDGKYSYSKVVSINIKIKISFVIYPNPVRENLFMQVQRDHAEKIILQITDIQGKILHEERQQLQAGITSLSFNTSALSKGTYLVLLKGQKTEAKTFVKE